MFSNLFNSRTFEKVSYEWLEEYKSTVRKSTYCSTTYRLRLVNEQLGKHKITRIDSKTVNKYLSYLVNNKKLRRRTVNSYKHIVCAVLTYARDRGYINNKQMPSNIQIPNNVLGKSDTSNKFLERHEIRQIIESMKKNDKLVYARMVTVLAYTGMRYGELTALDYTEDIDLQRKEITIRKTYDAIHKIINPTKTNAITVISLHDEAISAIVAQIAHVERMKKKFNLTNNFLFMSQAGTPIRIQEFNRILRENSPTKKRISSHFFRHSLITMLIEEGLPFHSIARQVGHKNNDMVSEVYGHVSSKMNAELVKTITNLKIE